MAKSDTTVVAAEPKAAEPSFGVMLATALEEYDVLGRLNRQDAMSDAQGALLEVDRIASRERLATACTGVLDALLKRLR